MSRASPYNSPPNRCECKHAKGDHDYFTNGVGHPGCLHLGCDCQLYRPAAILFVAVGLKVMRGPEHICEARSTTMAQRIAKALNLHKPNSRGI